MTAVVENAPPAAPARRDLRRVLEANQRSEDEAVPLHGRVLFSVAAREHPMTNHYPRGSTA